MKLSSTSTEDGRRLIKQSKGRPGRIGKSMLPVVVAAIMLGLVAFAATAEEPKFRLRDIPQRLLNRIQPTPANSTNTKTVSKQDKKPASPSGAMTAVAPQEKNTKPVSSDAEKLNQSIQMSNEDVASVSLGPNAVVNDIPNEGNAAQPLVLATEAEKNQKIADGWPEPWACFFITGRQHGYIEPCGCTGLENQKGGLNRRDTLLASLKERGWNMVPVDAGDQVRRAGVQQEIKLAHTVEAFNDMGYAAVAFGPEELQLTSTQLFLHMNDIQGKPKSQFVSSNVSILLPDAPERFKVLTMPNGRKIGVTSVLGDEYAKTVNNDDIIIQPAIAALSPIAEQLKKQKCDYYVLIANASLEETRKIAQQVPLFDLVVTAGGHGEPLYKPEPITGTKSIMVQVGVKGMYAGILGLFDDAKEPFRYQRIALSSQFEDSPRIMELFARYQEALKKEGFKNLGLKPLTHQSGREFVGTKDCADCHTTAYSIWKETPHAHATDSIVTPPGRGNVARHFDPECVSCHVTGWNPQGYFPYRTGYETLETSEHLTGNGCENCHGPGKNHSDYENGLLGEDEDLRKKLIEEMRLPLDRARDKCLECHDLDNSPNFHKDGAFEKYWEEVAHYGKN